MDILTHPSVLTAVFVGVGVIILVYILKLIRKDDAPEQKTKNEIPSHSEKRKDALPGGKTKKKVADNRWTTRGDKQAYSHPWLLTTLKGHTGSILDMDFSSNGKYLTSCGDEDPDPGGLASAENSSSSSDCSECTKGDGGGRSPSAEPRAKKEGLSRRQRKNRRREPSSAQEKPKKTRSKKLSTSSTESDSKKDEDAGSIDFPYSLEVLDKLLRTYTLTPDEMMLHGYPVVTVYGSVMIYKSVKIPAACFKKTKFDVNAREFVPRHESSDSGQGSSDSGESVDSEEDPSYERTCVRCHTRFLTTADKYLTREKCRYHWGKPRGVFRQFECCGARPGAPGCTRARLHVWNGIIGGANGPFGDFVRTRQCKTRADNPVGVFAVDCEMCYTVRGLECAKVTVVDARGRCVYDAYVRPDAEVVDHNTRFSGITASHLADAKSLRRVQADLLRLVDADAVLVGHGLENDLRALRLVHSNVVDTAYSFPHLRGLPYRRSLKNLAAHVLGKEIQRGDGEVGHDSFEDAVTAMELMMWRVCRDHSDYLRLVYS